MGEPLNPSPGPREALEKVLSTARRVTGPFASGDAGGGFDRAAATSALRDALIAYDRALPSPPPAGGIPEGWRALAEDAKDALVTLCARYGYESDGITPNDWSEWQEARRVHAALRALLDTSPPGEGWSDPVNDPKYAFRDGRVWNRASGEAIPDDEPVFVFRARDERAARLIYLYYEDLPPGDHEMAVLNRYQAFMRFAAEHPERMKEPDTAAPPASNGEA